MKDLLGKLGALSLKIAENQPNIERWRAEEIHSREITMENFGNTVPESSVGDDLGTISLIPCK